MPKIDPTTRFIIGILVTVAIGVSAGTLNLTNAVPKDWIPTVTAWAGIIAFIGSAIQTTISGAGMTTANRLASAAAVDGVKAITVDPKMVPAAVEAVSGTAQIKAA